MLARKPVDFIKVNGLAGDPAIYAFFQQTGAALLFDMGTLDKLSNRDLMRVRMVCVSHTHIDHFIGFDRLLRVNIPHGRPVEMIGPPGFIANVQGKLRGYLWNLLESAEQIKFIVHEIDAAGAVRSASLCNGSGFAAVAATSVASTSFINHQVDLPTPKPPVASIYAPPDTFAGVRIEAAAFDHKTPSLGYVCQMPLLYHVLEERLPAEGLSPGAWIKELQLAFAGRAVDPALTIEIEGRRHNARALGEKILAARAPRPLGYLTDIGFTRDNVQRARQLFAGVETLLCETNYRDTEHARARDRMHMTTRQGALLAALAGAKALEIFHVSNIYVDDTEGVAAEAAQYFAVFKELSTAALDAEVEKELARE